MKHAGLLEKQHLRYLPGRLLAVPLVALLVSCGGGSGSAPADTKLEDDGEQSAPGTSDNPTNELGTIEDDPVLPGNGSPVGNPLADAPDPESLPANVGLIVDSTTRCAKVFDPLQIVVTRKLAEGEEPSASGELPNVTSLVKFEQSFGTSLNLVSVTGESANFEIGAQDIVGLTASTDNGSVTTFIAGYEAGSLERFIMRKPVPNGCLYAFKSDDYCVAGLTKSTPLTFSRNNVSMSATGCQLDNPDDLPVIEVSGTAG